VAAKIRAGQNASSATEVFSYSDLISPANLQLIANLSGCEAHRTKVEDDCESDLCFHSKFRTFDGTCNNFARPLWGASLTAFRRILPAQYENGFSTPIGEFSMESVSRQINNKLLYIPGWMTEKLYNGLPKPGARRISNSLIASSKTSMDSISSHMTMQWGQFLDHDISHSMDSISRETFEFLESGGTTTTCGATCENRPPCFPIQIPEDDPR
jgi:peroxidase